MTLEDWGLTDLDVAILSAPERADYEGAMSEHDEALTRLGVRHLRVERPATPMTPHAIRREAAMLRRFATQQRFSLLSEPLFAPIENRLGEAT